MITVRIYWKQPTEEGEWVSEWTDVLSIHESGELFIFRTPTSRNIVLLANIQQIQITGETK